MTSTSALIRPAVTRQDILRCLPVLQQLRPHLRPENGLAVIQRLQTDGYVLLMLLANDTVAVVAGCRFGENLARGRYLYIDDFVTHSDHRLNRHGQAMFEWIVNWAQSLDCRELHLDSGVQRTGAHQFYEKQKMTFSSRHYSLKLNPS